MYPVRLSYREELSVTAHRRAPGRLEVPRNLEDFAQRGRIPDARLVGNYSETLAIATEGGAEAFDRARCQIRAVPGVPDKDLAISCRCDASTVRAEHNG